MEQKNMDTLQKCEDLDVLWNPLDPAGSEVTFRELLSQVRAIAGPDRTRSIELLTLIGRAESAQNRMREAHASLTAAEDLLKEEGAIYKVSARIRFLLERGRLYILEKTPSQANRLLSEAWTLAINSGEDYFVVDVAQTMILIERPKLQEKWMLEAIRLAESSPLPKTKRWLGSLYSTLGWKLFDLRQFENSLEAFQKALRHLKVNGSDREIFVAKWSTGKVLRALGKTEEALNIQRALVSELGIGGRRDGRLYEEMAECLQTLKRTSEAQLYFELAYRELSSDEWMNDNQPVKLKRLKDLGKAK